MSCEYCRKTPRVRGFSLVELLVVIVIIGVLLGLLLPAVQKARESASRMSCTNRMKQLGLALHNYVDVWRAFPPGWYSYDDGNVNKPCLDGEPGWGWATAILPYIEQSSLMESINLAVPMGTSETGADGKRINEEEIKRLLTVFRCPSERLSTKTFTLEDLEKQDECLLLCDHEGGESPHHHTDHTIEFATANFIGSFGTGDLCKDELEKYDHGGEHEGEKVPFDGAFGHNVGLSLKDFQKGLSNLLIVGERANEKVHYSTWVGVPPGCNPAMVVGTVYAPFDNKGTDHGYSSWHPTGANFLLGDGSVHFYSETTDPEVMEGLACRQPPGHDHSHTHSH